MTNNINVCILISCLLLASCMASTPEPKVITEEKLIACPPEVVEGECPACVKYVRGKTTVDEADKNYPQCVTNRDICAAWIVAQIRAWKECKDIIENKINDPS